MAAISHVNFGAVYTEMYHIEASGSLRYPVDASAAEWGEQKSFPCYWHGENIPLSNVWCTVKEGIWFSWLVLALLFILLCICKGLLGTSGDLITVRRAMHAVKGDGWEEYKEVSPGFTVSLRTGFSVPRDNVPNKRWWFPSCGYRDAARTCSEWLA